jgi:hypothetical protein
MLMVTALYVRVLKGTGLKLGESRYLVVRACFLGSVTACSLCNKTE